MSLVVSSPSFADGERIPDRHTCRGGDTSPALAWSGVPAEARSLVLIVDDPDAPGGTFFHWGVYDLPVDAGGLKAGFTATDAVGNSRQAVNDFRRKQWGGPCPPPGKEHHYRFRLLAVSTAPLKVAKDPHCRDVERAAAAALVEEAVLVGSFSR